jgi:phage tail sheath gpL-like
MPVAFESIQPNTLLPLFYAEVTSAAEPISENLVMCLVGTMNSVGYGEGTAVPHTMYPLSGTVATNLFGRGSMLDYMYTMARANSPRSEIWGIATDPDPVAAVRSLGKITIAKNATKVQYGLTTMWVAGRPVSIVVAQLALKATIAIQLRNRINSMALPVKAKIDSTDPSGATIIVEARWLGASGNDIALSFVGPHGRRGSVSRQVQLARWFYTVTGMSTGAGDPDIGPTLAAIGDRHVDVYASFLVGDAVLDGWMDFLDNDTGRWGPYQMKYGHLFLTKKGIYDNQLLWAETREDPHLSMLAVRNSVTSNWEWSACLASLALDHWAAPPELSRPLQGLLLRGCYTGTDDDETYDQQERQVLLQYGMSTFHTNLDTTCSVDRIRTLRKHVLGTDIPDPSWADAVTMFQTMYFVRAMKNAIAGAFPRCALTDLPMPINGFTSSIEIRAVIIHTYQRMASQGLVEHPQLFARYLVVERDTVDRNRVNVLMRPDFVNQLRVVATLVETHLELDSTDPTFKDTSTAMMTATEVPALASA